MKKILVVVDMQNDFIDGSLGTAEAVAAVPGVCEKIRAFDGDGIFVTYDTHNENYPDTLEGKKLPIAHCIEGTSGHELNPGIKSALSGRYYTEIRKTTFGTFAIVEALKAQYPEEEFEFEVVGLCTDVCVVTNVLILRSGYPNARITVDAACCAGITPKTHEAALATMECCQIDIVR